MKAIKTIALSFLFTANAQGYYAVAVRPCPKMVKIAVIDTGFGYLGRGNKAQLCEYGHMDFTSEKSRQFEAIYAPPIKEGVPGDRNGHGTNIAGTIDVNLKKAKIRNYCIVILKYYGDGEHQLNTVMAIKWATQQKYDYINYSSGGMEYEKHEAQAIKKYLDGGGKFVTVAGNEKSNLAIKPYYPAMDDPRVVVVGNMDEYGKRARSSNYGDRVNKWEVGRSDVYDISMSGTSQAAAIETSKMIIEEFNSCNF